MGACEDYKLRWTDKTYRRSTYAIYNNNARGRALRIGATVAGHAARAVEQDNHPL
jgi:hypothetical protein